MILSDTDLLDRLGDGDLVVEPIEDLDTQVQPASIDMRLGSEFLEFQRTNIPCIHPNRAEEVDEYVRETYVEEGDEFILHPGDFVLGTTKERVEIPSDLVATVEGRSSLGRLAVVVHASLPYEEEVFLWTPADGFGFYEIGEIVENEQPAHAVSFDPKSLRVSTHRVSDYIENPTKRIYRVELESGREVLVTRDHNLFTLDEHGGVTRIESEAAEGELVMTPGELPDAETETPTIDLLDRLDSDELTVYASDGLGAVDWESVPQGSEDHYQQQSSAPATAVTPTAAPDDLDVAFKQSTLRLPRHLPVTEAFGWCLGFYIAEGYARRKQVVVNNQTEAYVERFADFFESWDASLSWDEREDGVTAVTVCSALWSAVVRDLCGSGGEKTIPEAAWDWPTPVLEALYEGLIDGDGSRRENRDTLYTANAELADRAAYLGTRLGYNTSMYSRDREMYIEPSDCHNEMTEWCVDFSTNAHKRGQYVPTPSALLREHRNEAGLTMGEAADAMGYSSKSSISNVENREYDSVKRETLDRFREVYADAGVDTSRLDDLLDGDIVFDRVASVEKTDRVEPTYDLEVQPRGRVIENFLGGRGGVFLSNTAGFVDPGYRGQITLELSNLGAAPVALSPGMRVSQLVFTELRSESTRPYGSERDSKYQDQDGPKSSKIQDDPEFES
ncbi:MAG: deoxycytidine triphosphate deaminase [Halonotius sp. J07HN6]|nr:MAG: deoxycytidine triphosphate deaminase [Halonotius sp. J07HN6]